ncbi:hypothetical protein SCHPADRAFT_903449 [Schizopora paradoxa]|uniref:Uncharacterized protein n=1 Tax=Schizopora paradoxa TaxID=27342 RepID=A0A0H2RQX4_9AGAM|nr:hypothetical protein SCHPADRAFT_903449 [Schizopora paradoxa]
MGSSKQYVPPPSAGRTHHTKPKPPSQTSAPAQYANALAPYSPPNSAPPSPTSPGSHTANKDPMALQTRTDVVRALPTWMGPVGGNAGWFGHNG